MADINLAQAEADALIAMEKHRMDNICFIRQQNEQ
jgi:hypothetical protein